MYQADCSAGGGKDRGGMRIGVGEVARSEYADGERGEEGRGKRKRGKRGKRGKRN